ncbi:hypothetical protein AJ88_10800 [Mesorhizobium amorphae CCBAU 01583]|nr:hypothetical protein AJ88_10800 [Mesorhizobium amorphae CCBAU 01583]
MRRPRPRPAEDAFHRPFAGDGERAARIGDAQRLNWGRAAQPERDERSAEAVAGAGRIDLVDGKARQGNRAVTVVIGGAVSALLEDDAGHAALQELVDRALFVAGR